MGEPVEEVALYKVHFHLKDVEYQLVAESLDLTHPYFVSIKDMDLDYEEGLVVNPHLENTKKRFQDTNNIMIPLTNVLLIESVPARDKKKQKQQAAPKIFSITGGDDAWACREQRYFLIGMVCWTGALWAIMLLV